MNKDRQNAKKFVHIYTFLIFFGINAHLMASEPAARNIGSQRELFIDSVLFENFLGQAALRLHHPERREIVLVHDAPWEGNGCGYHTVFKDGDIYRMYYKAWHISLGGDVSNPVVTCYAESRDGIQWQKPDLGLVEFDGSTKNNIILNKIHNYGCHDFSPFIDTNPDVTPEQKYKAIGYVVGLKEHYGLYGFVSDDGIHWQLVQDDFIINEDGWVFDTQNIVFWSETENKYVMYYRRTVDDIRNIARAVSYDFVHWKKEGLIDFQDWGPKKLQQSNAYWCAGKSGKRWKKFCWNVNKGILHERNIMRNYKGNMLNKNNRKNRTRLFWCMWILLIMGCATDSTGKEFRAKIMSSKIICRQTNRYIGWPSIALTNEKKLVVVFSGDRDAHVCPWGKTQMVQSADNGITWSAPVTINNTPLDDRDAGIIQTTKGTIIASWFTSVAFVYQFEDKGDKLPEIMQESQGRHIEKLVPEIKRQWLGNWIRRSDNDGKTWGKPINTIVNAPHGPIQLSDGRLLYVGINKIIGDKNSPNPPDVMRIAAAESRDDGLTWNIIGYIPVPQFLDPGAKGFHELHAVETAEEKIVAMLRHHGEPGNKYLWQTESIDGGKTWTQAHQTKIWGYPPHLIRLENNWLLVTYGRRKKPYGERACISRDGGKTWDVNNELIISNAPNSDLGYPASVQLKDGSIYTIYYQVAEKGEKTCLMGTHWRIEEK